MTDYTELVKALRERKGLLCYGEGACPKNCELLMNHGCYTKLHMDAAAAIEELQARLGKAENSVERWKDMYLTKHEPKRGEWKETDMGWDGDTAWVCSVCGEPWTLIYGTPKENNMNYCPNCGAKMEVQE